MNPIAYCTNQETELISIAYKFANDKPHCIVGEQDIKSWAKAVDWSDKLVYGHNLSGFDAMILRWRLGLRPAMWGCTLAMARPLHAITVGGSLAKLVAHYKLGVKDQTALMDTKGRHLKDFTPQEVAAMREYNKADVDQCAALFEILLPLTPKREMKLIDMTVRMLVEPRFRVNTEMLTKTLAEEQQRKETLLLDVAEALGFDRDEMDVAEKVRAELASAPKFSAALERLGVEVPVKQSPSDPEKVIPALAKSDEAFLALQEHEDERVAAAARCRLDVKSTILESRIQSFLEVADCTGGRMPIAKNYYGAHTGRWSGAFGLNQENLPRVSGKPSDVLRMCLEAPPGHRVVVADLSGIELRMNHFLWRVPSSMGLFKADPEKADLYKDFASKLYDKPVSEVTKEDRQVGKVAHLGLGYGAGAATFQKVAKLMGGVAITAEESADIVSKWRAAYEEIVRGWRTCQASLYSIAQGGATEVDPWGLVTTNREGLLLPSGRMLRYPGLRQEANDNGKLEWTYGSGRHKTRVYAGKVTENIVQALARDVLSDNALEVARRTGLNPTHTVHDELVYIVPDDQAESHLAVVQEVMRTPPVWFPHLVTWSAGDVANSYGAAK